MCSSPALASGLEPSAINSAEFHGKMAETKKPSALAIKLQVLLDRAHFSPGEIDGHMGENAQKALQAFAEANQLPPDRKLNPDVWSRLAQTSSDPIISQYQLTEADIKGPYLKKIPPKMESLKSLPHLGYSSIKEMLGERFHMSPELLVALNPGQKFSAVGNTITVINVTPMDLSKSADFDSQKSRRNKKADKDAGTDDPMQVARIEVDKERESLKAFNKDGALVGFFPASVGSEEKPTPEGTLKVTSVEPDPTYRYDPRYKFKGVKSTKPFTIQPGPNNPVGVMWISLSKASYGIHGTPQPSRVSKGESHGCVRLTNWDVAALAHRVKKGVEVTFVDGQQASR